MTLRINDIGNDLNISLPSAERLASGATQMSTEDWHSVILVKILRELQTLNRLLHCHNFTNIPHTLKAIERQTKRRKRKTAPKLRAVA